MSTSKCCREVSFRYFWVRFSGIDGETCQEADCAIKWTFFPTYASVPQIASQLFKMVRKNTYIPIKKPVDYLLHWFQYLALSTTFSEILRQRLKNICDKLSILKKTCLFDLKKQKKVIFTCSFEINWFSLRLIKQDSPSLLQPRKYTTVTQSRPTKDLVQGTQVS